jgi:arginase
VERAVIALLCRTSDRDARGALGAQALATELAGRLGTEARMVGSPGEARAGNWDDDLRDSRGCLLEAGGQIDDALSGGRVPVLAAADCSIAVTTLPIALRHRPDARVLWLDAHGDYNTPETSGSGYLGGMCLAGACGEWDPGLGDKIDAERLVLAGVRDLDGGERELLERSAATVIGASVVETLVAVKNALDGAPVFIHLDLDVLDPEEFPAAVPAPGGLSSDKLYDLMEAVAEDSELVGIEVTAFEAPDDPDELADAAETAMRVLDPVLDRIAADTQE